VRLIDTQFTKQGYGFVNKAQIETEVNKRRVIVADDSGDLCGVRIGIDTIYNLVVTFDKRTHGIGSLLLDYPCKARTIRVKSDPIGHLSNAQKDNFVDPTGFYEKLGYKFWGKSFPKNFWQKGKDGKGQFHSIGDNPHIKIYKLDGTTLF
jgi:hypothetical protein